MSDSTTADEIELDTYGRITAAMVLGMIGVLFVVSVVAPVVAGGLIASDYGIFIQAAVMVIGGGVGVLGFLELLKQVLKRI